MYKPNEASQAVGCASACATDAAEPDTFLSLVRRRVGNSIARARDLEAFLGQRNDRIFGAEPPSAPELNKACAAISVARPLADDIRISLDELGDALSRLEYQLGRQSTLA